MRHALRRYGAPALVLESALLGLAGLGSPSASFAAFLALTTVAFAAFLIAAALAWKDRADGRAALLFVFGAGVVFRVTLLPFEPGDDMHRYLWEGRMQLEGLNPYEYPPGSPELEWLRDDVIYPRLGGKPYSAVYPPLAQTVFAATAAVSCTFLAFKLVFTAFDLLTGLLLVLVLRQRDARPARVLLYLWCPQVLFSVAGRGHLDSLQACLVVLALWLFLTGRSRAGGLTLGLAVLAKTLAIFLVPAFFLHAERRRDLWTVVLPFVLYLPYAGAGYGLLKSLVTLATDWTTNASLHQVFTLGNTFRPGAWFVGGVTYAVVMLRARRLEHAVFGAWATFFLFSPALHPWYLVGLIPFLALRWRPAWLLLTYTLFFYYAFWASGVWKPIGWMPLLEYAPFFLLLGWTARRSTRALPSSRRGTGNSVRPARCGDAC